MRKFLLVLSLSLSTGFFFPASGLAGNCAGKTCIDVSTDPGKGGIVITATQNSPGSSSRPKVRKAPQATRTHRSVVTKPRPRISPTPSRKPQVLRPRAVALPVRRPARTFTPKVVAAVSLSDSLTQLIPMKGVYSQPASAALTQMPVIFWTDTSTFFSTSATILGIVVGVQLRPTFEWDFGDGSRLKTSQPGAPYPSAGISHIYRTAGRYRVQLAVSWSGIWSAGGNSFPVLGDVIVQNFALDLVVSPGPTHYQQ